MLCQPQSNAMRDAPNLCKERPVSKIVFDRGVLYYCTRRQIKIQSKTLRLGVPNRFVSHHHIVKNLHRHVQGSTAPLSDSNPAVVRQLSETREGAHARGAGKLTLR